jgi:hypothetical protein
MKSKVFNMASGFVASHMYRYALRSQFLPDSVSLSNYVLALAVSADEKVVASGGTALFTFRVDSGEALRSFNWTGRCALLNYAFTFVPDILQMDYVRSIKSFCSSAVQRGK